MFLLSTIRTLLADPAGAVASTSLSQSTPLKLSTSSISSSAESRRDKMWSLHLCSSSRSCCLLATESRVVG
jgi:hypothetical protein